MEGILRHVGPPSCVNIQGKRYKACRVVQHLLRAQSLLLKAPNLAATVEASIITNTMVPYSLYKYSIGYFK